MWNPPWLLLWLSPMLFPPFPVSALPWMGLNIALLLAGALLARGAISAGTRLESRAAWLAAGLFVPSLFALKSGQISVIHLVGAAGSLWCATRGRDFAAGLFLALTSVKPHVVYLLWIVAAWWVVIRGRWSVAVGAVTLWFRLLSLPVLPEKIDEHGPLLFRPYGVMVFPMGLLFVAAFAGILPRPRVTWCIPLVWLALSFSRIRHGPLFAITAVLALGEMLPHVRWAAWLARSGSVLFRLRDPDQVVGRGGFDLLPTLLPALLVLTELTLQELAVQVPVLGRGWARLDPTHWPTGLLTELRGIEQNRPAGTPVFNAMLFGGFLIYATPHLWVFIDDRCELIGDRMLRDYARRARRARAARAVGAGLRIRAGLDPARLRI